MHHCRNSLAGNPGTSVWTAIGCDHIFLQFNMEQSPIPKVDGSRDRAFWLAHGGVGLVWSNPNASDSVMIMHALLQPDFHLLLDIAARFGLSRLKDEWAVLRDGVERTALPEGQQELRHATPIVERCLKHMEQAIQ